MEQLKVNLGERSYDIIIGNALLQNAVKYVKPVATSDRVVIITDENVAPLYLDTLIDGLGDIESDTIILPSGEQTKQFSHFEKLVDDILALSPDRKTTLIALGGGVIGDITGFAASVVLRGIPFIQMPTTLLSQVDSSVGGKTGINSKYGKNLIGSFYQPRLVLADTDTLNTLEMEQLKSGYAEVVKYGLIRDKEFFNWLDKNINKVLAKDKTAISYAIHKSCSIKADIVAKDELENDIRSLLNLGHTFGHALEVESGFDGALLHGEAVAIGMLMAAKFSNNKGLLGDDELGQIYTHLKKIAPDVCYGLENHKNLLAHMKHDKKADGGKIKLVLLRSIGDAYMENDANDDEILSLLEEFDLACKI